MCIECRKIIGYEEEEDVKNTMKNFLLSFLITLNRKYIDSFKNNTRNTGFKDFGIKTNKLSLAISIICRTIMFFLNHVEKLSSWMVFAT